MEAKLLGIASSAASGSDISKHTSIFADQTSSALQFPISRFLKNSTNTNRASSVAALRYTPKKRVDESQMYTLDGIRNSLIRLEESIIFSLVERAQFCFNAPTYDPHAFPMNDFRGSLVEYMVKETEKLHGKIGRYKSPDKHPFFPDDLPKPLLPPLEYPEVLNRKFKIVLRLMKFSPGHLYMQKNRDVAELGRLLKSSPSFEDNVVLKGRVLHSAADLININGRIWDMYFQNLLPRLVNEGDDGHYGSAATCDTICLQILSKRIHYGKFVAEAKFLSSPDVYKAAIEAQDGAQLMNLLTYPTVEEAVTKRVEVKTRKYGQEVNGISSEDNIEHVYKINPTIVAELYVQWIMPLTKQVQVEYLLRRLD